MDEIEMELPEGTDGPAGFQTRRKIKTRMDAKESFTMRPPLTLHCRTMRRPKRRGTDSRISESFPYEVWNDTFLR